MLQYRPIHRPVELVKTDAGIRPVEFVVVPQREAFGTNQPLKPVHVPNPLSLEHQFDALVVVEREDIEWRTWHTELEQRREVVARSCLDIEKFPQDCEDAADLVV